MPAAAVFITADLKDQLIVLGENRKGFAKKVKSANGNTTLLRRDPEFSVSCDAQAEKPFRYRSAKQGALTAEVRAVAFGVGLKRLRRMVADESVPAVSAQFIKRLFVIRKKSASERKKQAAVPCGRVVGYAAQHTVSVKRRAEERF